MKKFWTLFLIFVLSLTLTACDDSKQENITKITLHVSEIFRREDDFGSIYTLTDDGKVHLKKAVIDEDDEIEAMESTAQASAEEFQTLCDKLHEKRILKFPEKIKTDDTIQDGGNYSLTITTDSNEYTYKGSNPKDEDFDNCLDQIIDYSKKHLEE